MPSDPSADTEAKAMIDYSKKSWAELKICLENPVDTPDYIKAKDEQQRRMTRYSLLVAAGGILVAAAIKIFSK